MKALQKGSYQDKTNNWVLFIVALSNHGIAAAYSDGTVKIFPTALSSSLQPARIIKAHDNVVNGMKSIDNTDIIVTCAEDRIKVWDLRNEENVPIKEFTNDKASKYLSLGTKHGLLAAGTELQGVDAEVHVWDLGTGKLIRSFMDSHHDDVTDIKFHPTNKNLLLSGSTDGYVNVYDLTIEDEEDALHQVINFASVHSASFISPFRISTLSHMETFAIHDLEKDASEELTTPNPPNFFGDLRSVLGCEYVIDVLPGYIASGSNSSGHLMIHLFDHRLEKIDTASPILLLGGHGEEVVRAIHFDGNSGMIYTGGEDGSFKVWETPVRTPTPLEFFNPEEGQEVDMDVDEDEKKKAKNKKKKEKKEKKEHKEKKDKKKKKSKHKDVRFKPY